jgi:hypothetical protein
LGSRFHTLLAPLIDQAKATVLEIAVQFDA